MFLWGCRENCNLPQADVPIMLGSRIQHGVPEMFCNMRGFYCRSEMAGSRRYAIVLALAPYVQD
jgi:hypothetical protein